MTEIIYKMSTLEVGNTITAIPKPYTRRIKAARLCCQWLTEGFRL